MCKHKKVKVEDQEVDEQLSELVHLLKTKKLTEISDCCQDDDGKIWLEMSLDDYKDLVHDIKEKEFIKMLKKATTELFFEKDENEDIDWIIGIWFKPEFLPLFVSSIK